ncbi:MAG: type II toxin-antitoxin system RelE family toxin [Planctomycetota bacterium]|jgi:mRNA interferase RelE/StbE
MSKPGTVYRIEIAEAAANFIRGQPKKVQRQIMRRISTLAQDPYGKGRKIKSTADVLRIRSGDYRIAYVVKRRRVLVLVLNVGHRSNFYRYYET